MLRSLVYLFYRSRRNHRYRVNHRRVDVRIPTKDGRETKWAVRVTDISLGGTAFIYEGSPADLAKSGLIALSEGDAVKFKTVWDIESTEEPRCRRRGVRFQRKGILCNNQIIQFINHHALHGGGREGLRPPDQPAYVHGEKGRGSASAANHFSRISSI